MRKNYLVYDRFNNEVALSFHGTFDNALAYIKKEMKNNDLEHAPSVYIRTLQKQKDEKMKIKPYQYMGFWDNMTPIAEVLVNFKDDNDWYIIGIVECMI